VLEDTIKRFTKNRASTLTRCRRCKARQREAREQRGHERSKENADWLRIRSPSKIAPRIPTVTPLIDPNERLFGHEKGAFTGATARREGRFEAAAGGTLFLDEIGDLDPGLQTKLLRVLQEGTFERVGSQETIRSTARIVAATSRPVLPKTPGATLREDLFYRLAVLHIELPPLRERRSDIPVLVQSFLQHLPGPRRAVSEAAMARLLAHDWPGNVRELLHVLERASVMSASEVLDEEYFAAIRVLVLDPRIDRRRLHPLTSLLVLSVIAVICGAGSFVAIEDFGQSKKAWLKTFLDLPSGIPSHDTPGRVFAILDPGALAEAFRAWRRAVAGLTQGGVVKVMVAKKFFAAGPRISAIASRNGPSGRAFLLWS